MENCDFDNFNKLNYEKWIENLFKFDDKFAIQSIESILAEKYHDKNLWKAYIKIMHEKNLNVSF